MALTYPYPLAFFSDILHAGDVSFDLQRNDEMSGSGDARYWSAELATPLWTADIPLQPLPKAEARAINAKVRGLDGTSKTFLVADPSYDGPAAGVSGFGSITLSAISADRGRIYLTGWPGGTETTITAGDYISFPYGDRVYFGVFVEGGTASGASNMPSLEVRPYLPFGVQTGISVEMISPFFKAIIPPGGFRPYRMNLGDYGAGASLTILQKI